MAHKLAPNLAGKFCSELTTLNITKTLQSKNVNMYFLLGNLKRINKKDKSLTPLHYCIKLTAWKLKVKTAIAKHAIRPVQVRLISTTV